MSTQMFTNLIRFHVQAESLGTTILDEDGLLELIRTKPGKKSKYEIAAEAEVVFHVFFLFSSLLQN